MSCNQGSIEVTGSGKAVNIERAFQNAFNDAKKKGNTLCIGGSCSNPAQKCGFGVTGISNISVAERESAGGHKHGYDVELTASGGCSCVDW